MNDCKKIIINLLIENKILTVKLSPEGDSPALVKDYIESLNLSSNDKNKFNKDLVNGFKEYKIDMSKCAVEIEKETAKLNKFWESKLNKILQQGETREAEYQVQLSEYQNHIKNLQKEIDNMKRVLTKNGFEIN